ncbi:MAG: YfcE family phosphodiesterase [Planctomicrobium sp.]|nr:YfcE family phosphodiesterase [Planctomicrobium sp.]
MRILVLGDIHSNWVALRAIEETFDFCVFTGDLVDYGTDPLPCIDWIRRHANASVRGNHDHAVAQRVQGAGKTGYRRLAAAIRPLHWELIDTRRQKFLARLPVTTHFRVDNLSLHLVHATPRDPMDEYLNADPVAWKQRLVSVNADIVCVGHSHSQFHLNLDEIQVLNPGSVGQPRDGDPRAAYAIIENGNVSLHRIEYNIDEAVEQVRSTGVPDWVVELNKEIWTSGGHLSKEQMDEFC